MSISFKSSENLRQFLIFLSTVEIYNCVQNRCHDSSGRATRALVTNHPSVRKDPMLFSRRDY